MIWKPRTTTQIVRAAVLTFSVAPAMVHAAAQQQVQVTGVRLDTAFRLVGSNSSGFVVSVKVSELKPGATSNDFALVNFDDKAHRTGETACLAMRFLDGADPKPPWILLDDPAGTLARSYRALIESHAAVAEKTRR